MFCSCDPDCTRTPDACPDAQVLDAARWAARRSAGRPVLRNVASADDGPSCPAYAVAGSRADLRELR